MPAKPTVREQVRAALAEHGPMTYAQLAEVTGLTPEQVNRCINRDRKAWRSRKLKRWCYVMRWERNLGREAHGKPSPVWKLGSHSDAPMPEPVDRRARYEELHRARRTVGRRRRVLCPMAHMAAALGARVG